MNKPAQQVSSRISRKTAATTLMVLCMGMAGWSTSGTVFAQATGHEHHHMLGNEEAVGGVQKFERTITLPTITMTRADGARVPLAATIDDGRPVVLNFIFTTCTAVCPVTSQVFAEFRGLLSPGERDGINMISISIDPEQDTPRKLAAYAKRFGNNGTWPHLTGTMRDSELVQRAFEAWRGDKMNHLPQTFLRSAPGKSWIRLDGFISPEGLLAEYRSLGKK